MSLNREKELFKVTKSVDGYPIRKKQYGEKLIQLLENSQKILVVGVDHIGSTKLSELRKTYRGRARFLFGKNTLIRRILRQYVRQTGRLEVSSLIPALRGNCGLIFLNGNPTIYDMAKLQNEIVAASRLTCAPRAGDIAPCDVFIHPMDTGLEPTRTTFFAAMNIATKINRGQIQIINHVCVVRAGARVGASQAALLHSLGLKPFSYAIMPIALYDEGECYPASFSQNCDAVKLMEGLNVGMRNASALSFGVGCPNLLTVPHSVHSAYEMMVALGVECLGGEYSWKGLDDMKAALKVANEMESVGPVDVIAVESPPSTPSPEPVGNPWGWGDTTDEDSCDDSG